MYCLVQRRTGAAPRRSSEREPGEQVGGHGLPRNQKGYLAVVRTAVCVIARVCRAAAHSVRIWCGFVQGRKDER